MRQIAVFASGRGSNYEAIEKAILKIRLTDVESPY